MIQIIKPDKHERYKIECEYCGCVFTFEDVDILNNGSQKDYDEKVICPFCHEDLWFNGNRSKYYIRRGHTF